jgi:hypothetical protein
MRLLKILLALLLTFSVTVPNFVHAKEKESTTYRTVESFEMEVLSTEVNDENLYEVTGSKKVNSITEITEGSDFIKTKIISLEDFYDLEGEYIKTVLKIEEFSNNFSNGKAKHKIKEKEFNQPKTIHTLSKKTKIKGAEIKDITEDEEKELENYLMNLVHNTKEMKLKEKDIKGMTFKELNDLREIASEFKEKKVVKIENNHLVVDKKALNEIINENKTNAFFTTASTVEAAGAFDNYYNHNLSNGNFVAQALSSSPHKYVKITGTTNGNSKNASTLVKFKDNIDSYERYIIDRMEYATWTEVAGWFGVLMGLVTIVVGFPTGPVGWVEIVLYYGGALATFAGLTSSAYATYSRLSLSRYAAQYCQNARDLLYYTNWSNVNMTVVNGF